MTEPLQPPPGCPSIRRAMMPRDTNAMGFVFGGTILAEMDLAAGIEARLHSLNPVVTVAFDQVEFKQPVQVGDVISFHTETVKVGRTSIVVKVDVWAKKRMGAGRWVFVTEGKVTMVAVDENMRPTLVTNDPEAS